MRAAAKAFEFEKAAQYRDRIKALKTPTPYEQTEVGGTDRLGADG
jgi:excinuclease UvrABC nuclease subunit